MGKDDKIHGEVGLPGAVGGGRDNGLSRASLDLGDVEVKQGQLSALLLVDGAAHQSGDFRQGKDLFYQQTEGSLAHAAHFRGHALHICPTGDKAVLQLLLPVLILLQHCDGFVQFLLQFLSCFFHCDRPPNIFDSGI